MLTLDSIMQVIHHTINKAEYCFLITHDLRAGANARQMQPFGPDEEMNIWFGSGTASRKIREIEKYEKVTLAYGYHEESAYVTLKGIATRVDNDEIKRKYWRSSFLDFWPDGAPSENYTVVKFVPNYIEAINFKQKLAPEPYGLKPAILVREDDIWRIEYPKT